MIPGCLGGIFFGLLDLIWPDKPWLRDRRADRSEAQVSGEDNHDEEALPPDVHQHHDDDDIPMCAR